MTTLSTHNVPSHFLKAAYLVGHVPIKALASDPRISYMLYIPPTHYDNAPNGKKLPLLVWIHGTRRRLGALDDGDLVSFADSTPCAVLAPLFPAGLDGPNDLDSYKLLRSKTLRSDLALLSILDEVAPRWPGLDTDKVFMLGFSGGGQFAHRFLYLYPERLLGVSIGAPGRVTLLDDDQEWPVGVSNVETLFDRGINKEGIRGVDIQLVVGSEDNQVHGGSEFWDWMKKMKGKGSSAKEDSVATMTQGRLQTLQGLKGSWAQDGIESRLDIVPGAGHESEKMRPRQLEFLGPLMGTEYQNRAQEMSK